MMCSVGLESAGAGYFPGQILYSKKIVCLASINSEYSREVQ